MKRLFAALTISIVFFGCSDKKVQEQKLLDSVGSMHEKLMGLDDKLDKNQSLLDTLIKKMQPGVAMDSAKMYRDKVVLADSLMMNWMHGFRPDSAFKSHEETMSYLQDQKRLIMHVDSQMNDAFKTSGAYLDKINKK